MPSRRIILDGPLELQGTLGAMATGRHDPTWRLGGGEAWRAMWTPDGSATLHLELLGSEVVATAWGRGGQAALERVPAMIGPSPVAGGRRDPLADAPDRVVRDAARRRPGLRMGASTTVVATAVRTVLGQRVTSREAARSWVRLVRRFGEAAPGPGDAMGLMVPPAATVLASIGYAELHPLGVERGRAETIRRVCRHATRLEELVGAPWEEARRVLPLIDGVGPWTVANVVTFALGDPDSPVVGDYHLPHHVGFALEDTPRSSDERMLELLEPYAGQRGRAQRLIVVSSPHAPRFGPRQRILPVARM